MFKPWKLGFHNLNPIESKEIKKFQRWKYQIVTPWAYILDRIDTREQLFVPSKLLAWLTYSIEDLTQQDKLKQNIESYREYIEPDNKANKVSTYDKEKKRQKN